MPIIIGLNISASADREWRDRLRAAIKKTTAEYWKIPETWVEATFPHDPSTPENEDSTAAFIVDILFDRKDRRRADRQKFAEVLRVALEPIVNEVRGTKNSRVEVEVPPYSQRRSGFSATPTPSHRL